jgi:hypothetical protein
MRKRQIGLVAGVVLTLATVAAVAIAASVSTPVQVTTTSPLISCDPNNNNPDGSSKIYDNTVVEPYTAVNPTNSDNVVAVWQQDRRNDGGARGLLAAFSTDAGQSWTTPSLANQADFSACSGGNAANSGDYARASDPWVTFDGHGNAFQISISFTTADFISQGGPSAVIVSKSTARTTPAGAIWGPNTVLKSDTSVNSLNDKESITGDPHHPDNVYAVWDRLVFPNTHPPAVAGENAVGFHGPAWFSRTTDDGATWEPARIIFDPGAVSQTIGNEIVPLGDDSAIVDGFNLLSFARNSHQVRGMNVALIRSTDHGTTWGDPIIVSKLESVGVRNSNGELLRTSDDIPQFAADPRSNSNTIYAVWQDARFSGGTFDQIAFSKSTDGGLHWSTPERISTHAATPAFLPSIRVGSDGTVNVTYYDFRNDSDFDANPDTAGDASKLMTDVSSLTSTDGGSSFTENRVTPSSFDFRSAPVARGFFLGDYQGLDFASGGALPGFKPVFGESNGTDATGCTTTSFTASNPTCPTTSPHSDIFSATITP